MRLVHLHGGRLRGKVIRPPRGKGRLGMETTPCWSGTRNFWSASDLVRVVVVLRVIHPIYSFTVYYEPNTKIGTTLLLLWRRYRAYILTAVKRPVKNYVIVINKQKVRG